MRKGERKRPEVRRALRPLLRRFAHVQLLLIEKYPNDPNVRAVASHKFSRGMSPADRLECLANPPMVCHVTRRDGSGRPCKSKPMLGRRVCNMHGMGPRAKLSDVEFLNGQIARVEGLLVIRRGWRVRQALNGKKLDPPADDVEAVMIAAVKAQGGTRG